MSSLRHVLDYRELIVEARDEAQPQYEQQII